MNLEDITLSGNLKLKHLSAMIKRNEDFAKYLKVRMSWGYLNDKVYARVHDGDNIIFHKYYEKQYVHICLACMQLDFEKFLNDLNKRRIAARPKPPEDNRPFHIRRAESEREAAEKKAAAAAKDAENLDYGVDRSYDD